MKKTPIMIMGADFKEIENDFLIKYCIKSKESVQEKEKEEGNALIELPPPYNPKELSMLREKDTVLNACILQTATDTAGLGYKFVPVSKEAKQEECLYLEKVFSSFSEDITTTMKNQEIDYLTTGNSFLEIVFDEEGLHDIVHWSINDMRKTKNEDIVVQQVLPNSFTNKSMQKVYFSKYGSHTNVDYRTGEMVEDIKNEATQYKWFSEYNPNNYYYGQPCYIPAVINIYCNHALNMYNTSNLEKNRIPTWAIYIKGDFNGDEEIKANIRNDIKSKLNNIQQNPGSPLVITLDGQDFEVVFEKLSADDKDAEYLQMKNDNTIAIASCFRMPLQRLGISIEGSLNGSNSAELLENYKNSIIEPRQYILESFINKVIRETTGITDWEFKFNDIDMNEEAALLTKLKDLFGVGAVSPNEIREQLGLDKINKLGMDDYYIQGRNISNPEVNVMDFTDEVYKSRDMEFIEVLKGLEGKTVEDMSVKKSKNKEPLWKRWFQ